MRTFFIYGALLLLVHTSVAPPVTKNKSTDEDKTKDGNEIDEGDDMEETMEYHRYLKEVVQILESDEEFRKKLDKAEEVDIRNGKIAHELEFVNHNVRTKLDELKRQEVERLRHLAIKEYQLENDLDLDHLKIAEHLDHKNPHTFEVQDLKKLISKTTADLAEADRRRREEFKEYEMQKKFEEEQKLKGNTGMDEQHKKEYEEELHKLAEKHKKHEPLHHPGSKPQLEEVWEKQDHMESQDFDPKTFFYLHDLDGNGVWDQNEVKALFLKELDKLYAEGAPEDDLRERAEEMERMREHVFKEADTNNDGLINFTEFLEQTKKPDFQQDEGWHGLDEQELYSQQEYEAFERRRQEEIEKLIAKGVLPPHPANYPPGHHEQFPPQYANAPVYQGVPQPGYVQTNEIPQGNYQGQPYIPQQQFQGQQVPQQQFQGQQVPQQQFQAQQVPQQQFQGQHVPQQQFQGQHVPQQQFQGQAQLHAQQLPAQQQFQGQPQFQAQPVAQQQYQGQPLHGVSQQQQPVQNRIPQQNQPPQQQQAPQQQQPPQQQRQPAAGSIQQPVHQAAPVAQPVPSEKLTPQVQQQQHQPPPPPNVIQSNPNIASPVVSTNV